MSANVCLHYGSLVSFWGDEKISGFWDTGDWDPWKRLFGLAVHCFHFLQNPNMYHIPHQIFCACSLKYIDKAEHRRRHPIHFPLLNDSSCILRESEQRNAWEEQESLLFETDLIQCHRVATVSLNLCYMWRIPVVPSLYGEKGSSTYSQDLCTKNSLDCEWELRGLIPICIWCLQYNTLSSLRILEKRKRFTRTLGEESEILAAFEEESISRNQENLWQVRPQWCLKCL